MNCRSFELCELVSPRGVSGKRMISHCFVVCLRKYSSTHSLVFLQLWLAQWTQCVYGRWETGAVDEEECKYHFYLQRLTTFFKYTHIILWTLFSLQIQTSGFQIKLNRNTGLEIFSYRSLGALRAPTSSWRPFGPLDFVLRALRALRPCDPCHSDWVVC